MVDGTAGARHPDRNLPVASAGDPARDFVDEVDFPDFVGELIAGIFDTIVEESIRQMEAFSRLVETVAKSVQEFLDDNVSDAGSSPRPGGTTDECDP